MGMCSVGGRRLPLVPIERRGGLAGAHAALCGGDADALSALLGRIRTRRTTGDDVAVYGRWLFECLLEPAWRKILADPGVVAGVGVELALRWPAAATDLHRLVWEAMRDGDGHALAGHPHLTVAITRLVPGPTVALQTIDGMPRVLFASSTRLADVSIRPGAMYMGLLQSMDAEGQCRSRAAYGISKDDLAELCGTFGPDVVHLVAHGVLLPDGRGALMLNGRDGPAEADAEALVAALSAYGRPPVAVILSACNSASAGESGMAVAAGPTLSDDDPTDAAPLAAQLIAKGITVVSAMAGEVGEPACRLYTRRFSHALHEGKSVVEASAHGRRAALVNSAAPAADLDWALPTLYLAENVDPRQPLVRFGSGAALASIANSLRLRREPVFIGQPDLLAAADQLIDARAGVLAILAKESIRRMGGTRLLQEIGWRLLRDGHVPLFLGPYDRTQGPATARLLVGAILSAMVLVAENFSAVPPFPQTLLIDEEAGDYAARAAALAAQPKALARREIRRLIAALQRGGAPLDIPAVRDLLAEDLIALADLAATWGHQFGGHTRIVILCDNVHQWGPPEIELSQTPDTGLSALLALVSSTGLGRPDRPMPVIFTGSRTEAGGRQLTHWATNLNTGYRVVELKQLDPADAVLGYQWILLHPWLTKAASNPYYRHTYTGVRGQLEQWEGMLLDMTGCRPTSSEGLFPLAAALARNLQVCRSNDDELAWRTYVEQHPESQP
jgi:hypothetical protein